MSTFELRSTQSYATVRTIVPGTALALAIAIAAVALQRTLDVRLLNPMLVAIVVGVLIRLVMGSSLVSPAGLAFAARPILRAGIILLGLQVTLAELGSLGVGAFVAASITLAATYAAMVLVGRAMGLPAQLTKLIAAGTAVCGASAVVAVNSVIRAKEEDVGYAVASVTLFGTFAMIVLPLIAVASGIDPVVYGVWAGASIHEVAQVAAAAFQLGPEAGQAGTITKLIRVVLLAPLVIAIAFSLRRGVGADSPSVAFPWFVFGFIALVGINSAVELPEILRSIGALATTIFLSAGLAAMGLAMDLGQLKRSGIAPLFLGALGCLFILGFGYCAVILLL